MAQLLAISNEKIMSALIATGSVRASAKAACISETIIQARSNDADFRAKYEKAKSEMLTEACGALAARLTIAVNVLDSDARSARIYLPLTNSKQNGRRLTIFSGLFW